MLEKWRNSLKLTVDELLYKVTWPTWEELQESAIITLIASLIIALLVFIMDTVFENTFEVFYEIFQ
ncbi:MAG: preprotein translocase subunit SecE [Bacteroidia bacterium]